MPDDGAKSLLGPLNFDDRAEGKFAGDSHAGAAGRDVLHDGVEAARDTFRVLPKYGCAGGDGPAEFSSSAHSIVIGEILGI